MFSWKPRYKLKQIIFDHGQIETRIWRIYSALKFRGIYSAHKLRENLKLWHETLTISTSVIEKISSETRRMIQRRRLAKGTCLSSYWISRVRLLTQTPVNGPTISCTMQAQIFILLMPFITKNSKNFLMHETELNSPVILLYESEFCVIPLPRWDTRYL